MIFNSVEFLIFLLVVLSVFWLLSKSDRRLWMLLSSYFFYGFLEPRLVLLLMIVTCSSFCSAILLSKEKNKYIRAVYFVLGLVLLILPLIYFKYFNFIVLSINEILDTQFPLRQIILPVGISFYSFQTAGYLIDVYRCKSKPCNNFISFALYVSFFPQLVAGPIERVNNLLPQLSGQSGFHLRNYNSSNFIFGLKMIIWGLFKKVVVADRLAGYVDPVYANVSSSSGLLLLCATFCFAFQIYCDFSGYSDMAIGIARMFGVSLMKNFDRPYFSRSIIEFWRRWHISLSTWFKDYVYIPLGGNKTSYQFWCVNILLVFVISGFWHGAKWTFVVWGLLHGISMIAARSLQNYYAKFEGLLENFRLKALFNWLITFLYVNITWVVFRAASLNDAYLILRKIFNESFGVIFVQQFNGQVILIPVFVIAMLICLEINQGDEIMPRLFNSESIWVRRGFYYLMVLILLLFGYWGKSPFIYFQF